MDRDHVHHEGMGLSDWIPGRRPRRVTGAWAFRLSLVEGVGNLERWSKQAWAMIVSIWIGVALAILISAVMRGVERDVQNSLPRDYVPPQIDLDTITGILAQGRWLLFLLAIGFSAVLVGVVAWIAADRRRREVGIKRQFGLAWREVLWEVWCEGTVLCLLGCTLGVLTGLILCMLVPMMSVLSADVRGLDILMIVTIAIFVDLFVIGAVFEHFAKNPSADQDL